MSAIKSKERKGELTLLQKKKIIDDLVGKNISIDFSGGELFYFDENIQLIEYASLKLGRNNIGVSTSGWGYPKYVKRLKNKINDIELSIDAPKNINLRYRPRGYHKTAFVAISKLKANKYYLGVQTVLTTENSSIEMLIKLMEELIELNVDEWSLLRFFTSGRGMNYPELVIRNLKKIKQTIAILEKISNGRIKIKPHYSFSEITHCNRAAKKSIGIMPNGIVTGCFWAVDKNGNVLDKFKLGDLKNDSICDVLA
jgi:MoaA/NifB/PqqE/SkfB family radical SAM enzyme